MVVGIGFYKRDQWPLLLETAADSYILENTYDEWLDVLDSSLDKISAQGMEPEIIEVDVEGLLDFCNKCNIQNDAVTRSRYIAELFHKKHG